MRIRSLVAIVLVGSLVLLQSNTGVKAAPQVGPIDVSGDLDGAPYRIVVPAAWNGTLLLYGHGYRDKADHPGEIDNRVPEIAPSAAAAQALLAQGYALAGSAYKDNGWAVRESIVDTRRLATFFRHAYAKPERTLLWSFSLSTLGALRNMERSEGLFDGALAGCAVGAGASSSWDQSGDLALAYDTVFGLPASWGTIGDVRDDLDFETEVQPKLAVELGNPANFPKWEFVRLVTGAPGRGLVPPAPPAFYPGWVVSDMFYATEVRAELERRAGGPVVQNLDRDYSLTVAERAYLGTLGVPGAAIDAWLAMMNAQRTVQAPPFSRRYLKRNADYSGKIKSPVLTMHTAIDPLVSVAQEDAYRKTVAAARRSRNLVQVYTSGVGHCNFTPTQVFMALDALNRWVDTGKPPTAASFPAAAGFLPGFVPPAMIQP